MPCASSQDDRSSIWIRRAPSSVFDTQGQSLAIWIAKDSCGMPSRSRTFRKKFAMASRNPSPLHLDS